MSKETSEMDMSMWFSTYGLVTVSRILERFHIHLDNEQLSITLKNPYSIYYQLLHIPLRNVFNGIIYQQVYDYQVYAQKLFVDYLLSSAVAQDESAPGSNTREDLDTERQALEELNEEFEHETRTHQRLISDSQTSLVQISKDLNESLNSALQIMEKQGFAHERDELHQALTTALIYQDKDATMFWKKLAEILKVDISNDFQVKLQPILDLIDESKNKMESLQSGYVERVNDVNIALRGYRSGFYNLILRTVEYLNLLPDYHINVEKDLENRSSLHFNSRFGEEGV